ncbi:hypothetical protein BDA99DRAFT_542159 [Phascolomyces articulosus]|uniref:Uncharacterized protein n=1 Tax=Phascolomyces articulosus TaxID=60185 RepID=A0AAD5K1C5_9FUNG|nr:hypothetical protein BDA99DRAFT_542159 [Phascolomyces articulosus]
MDSNSCYIKNTDMKLKNLNALNENVEVIGILKVAEIWVNSRYSSRMLRCPVALLPIAVMHIDTTIMCILKRNASSINSQLHTDYEVLSDEKSPHKTNPGNQ